MVQQYREIILHAGLGKTGSSSMQDSCWRQRKVLQAAGIHYPAFELGGRRLVNHSDALAGAICESPADHGVTRRHAGSGEAEDIRGQLRPQLDRLLQHPEADTLLLSGEVVANFSDSDLQALRAKLAPHTRRLRVLAYIRSPLSALESMLQQRARGGNPVEAESLVGVVRERYETLERNFSGLLEWVDFHQACQQPGGLVGSFFRLIGVADDRITGLDFASANESMSQEAYDIMAAINRRFPREREAEHQVNRMPADLGALQQLPGQRFGLPDFLESALYQQALVEAEWLQGQLGFEFPPLQARASIEPWQMATLEELESTVRKLQQPQLQSAATDYLLALAEQLTDTRPHTAGALELIGRRLRRQKNEDISGLAEQLGADYFKFAALQSEQHSPRLALTLMSLAQALKPGGELINQRVEVYRRKLETRGK